MSSGLFSIANTALLTQQTVMQTISQNIANAQTPGYSRQETVLQQNEPERFAWGSVGTGVRVQTIIRRRAVVLDDAFRTAAGTAGETQMRGAASAVPTSGGRPWIEAVRANLKGDADCYELHAPVVTTTGMFGGNVRFIADEPPQPAVSAVASAIANGTFKNFARV